MLHVWLSFGYVILLAIFVIAFILFMAQGGSRPRDRCTRGGYPPLV